MNWMRQSLTTLFHPRSPEVLAAQSAAEYAHSMAVYHQQRINRLQQYLKGDSE